MGADIEGSVSGGAVGKFTLEFVWGTNETGIVFSGGVGTLTHNLGNKDIFVSIRSVIANNSDYDVDELTDVGYDPFRIHANGVNTLTLRSANSGNTTGTWAITVLG